MNFKPLIKRSHALSALLRNLSPQRYILLVISAALSIAFMWPSLIDGSRNAGFLYTGDVAGFYTTTVIKEHSLLSRLNFQAIDYSLFNGSSDFFVSPNFFTFNPFLVIYSILQPIHKVDVINVGHFIVLLSCLYVFISMYYSATLIQRILRFRTSFCVFGGAFFAFNVMNLAGFFQPVFLFSIALLPWIIYANLRFHDDSRSLLLLPASVPTALAIMGGYIPLGLATIALGSVFTIACVYIEASSVRFRPCDILARIVRAMMPAVTGMAACAPLVLMLFLYHKETSSANRAEDLFYSAYQLADAPVAILRALSDNLKTDMPFYEFSATLGIVPLIIIAVFFLTKGLTGLLSRLESSVLKLSLLIYGATLLCTFGVYSVVSDFVYYFVPQIGSMHIYQRFLWPANLALALALCIMLRKCIECSDGRLIRGGLFLMVALTFATAMAVLGSVKLGPVELTNFNIVELLAGVFFLVALLLGGRTFPVLVATALVMLPGFDKSYQLSTGDNRHSEQVKALPLYLDAQFRGDLVRFIKGHTRDKSFIKYVDLTPMWGAGREQFIKQFPYLELDQLNLSSFGGFTFYLSSRDEYMRRMPIWQDVRINPDWNILREAGVDFAVLPADLSLEGDLGKLVNGAPSEDVFSLPNGVRMYFIGDRIEKTMGTASFDNGMFRLTATKASLDNLENVALGKPTKQSGIIAASELAVDGNTNGEFAKGSVTHSAQSKYAWLDLDLGSSTLLKAARIWNRTDCCSYRLSDFWIFVSDIPFLEGDTPDSLRSRPGTQAFPASARTAVATVPFLETRGRYVRIQLAGTQKPEDSFLHIAELQLLKALSVGGDPTPFRGDVTSFSSNFANHSQIEVDLSAPGTLEYLFWDNPRLTYLVDSQKVEPVNSGAYPAIHLPPGRHVIEIRYQNLLMVAVWITLLVYWLGVVGSGTLAAYRWLRRVSALAQAS